MGEGINYLENLPMWLPLALLIGYGLGAPIPWVALGALFVYDVIILALAKEWLEGRATIYVDHDAIDEG